MAGNGMVRASGVLCGLLLLASATPAAAGMPWRVATGEGRGDGAHVDLVVRSIAVSPARAHVGDTIAIEMVWQYWGDLINNYYDTTFAEVRANGTVIARSPFVYNFGARLGDEYRETFLWDTRGAAPGKYRIRGEVPLRLDATPYDNFLVVKEPVLLVPAGAPFPAGQERGGSAAAENPFLSGR